MSKDVYVYQLILNPKGKLPTIEADPKKFARMVQNEMESVMSLLASSEKMITMDGQTFDKTTSLGALIINDKLAELESRNTQNFNLLNVVRKTEDSLRQMLG